MTVGSIIIINHTWL